MSTLLQEKEIIFSDESCEPLYLQLFNFYKRQIEDGVFKPGDTMPSENQLCQKYNISRSTVRQALAQLANEHMIIRRRGRGKVVASQKLSRSLGHLYNFTEDMRAEGLVPHSKVLQNIVTDAPDEAAHHLMLDKNSLKVFKLMRIRLADNEPLLVETTYLPYSLCHGIEDFDFSKESLYITLQKIYRMNIFRAVESFEPARMNRENAALLNCRESSLAFSINRVAYLVNGAPVEYTRSISRADKCVYSVEMHTAKNELAISRKFQL